MSAPGTGPTTVSGFNLSTSTTALGSAIPVSGAASRAAGSKEGGPAKSGGGVGAQEAAVIVTDVEIETMPDEAQSFEATIGESPSSTSQGRPNVALNQPDSPGSGPPALLIAFGVVNVGLAVGLGSVFLQVRARKKLF